MTVISIILTTKNGKELLMQEPIRLLQLEIEKLAKWKKFQK